LQGCHSGQLLLYRRRVDQADGNTPCVRLVLERERLEDDRIAELLGGGEGFIRRSGLPRLGELDSGRLE
jgi:hypothetical protein